MFVKGSVFNFNIYVLNKKSKKKCKVKKGFMFEYLWTVLSFIGNGGK